MPHHPHVRAPCSPQVLVFQVADVGLLLCQAAGERCGRRCMCIVVLVARGALQLRLLRPRVGCAVPEEHALVGACSQGSELRGERQPMDITTQKCVKAAGTNRAQLHDSPAHSQGRKGKNAAAASSSHSRLNPHPHPTPHRKKRKTHRRSPGRCSAPPPPACLPPRGTRQSLAPACPAGSRL